MAAVFCGGTFATVAQTSLGRVGREGIAPEQIHSLVVKSNPQKEKSGQPDGYPVVLYYPAILIYRIAGQINLLIPKYAGSALVQLSLVE